MSIIICKSLLLLSIILALVSFFSRQWLNIITHDIFNPKLFKKYNTGLWYGCVVNEKSVKTCGQTEKILSDIMGVSDRWILSRTFMVSVISQRQY